MFGFRKQFGVVTSCGGHSETFRLTRQSRRMRNCKVPGSGFVSCQVSGGLALDLDVLACQARGRRRPAHSSLLNNSDISVIADGV
jgi:hypothetical protein